MSSHGPISVLLFFIHVIYSLQKAYSKTWPVSAFVTAQQKKQISMMKKYIGSFVRLTFINWTLIIVLFANNCRVICARLP